MIKAIKKSSLVLTLFAIASTSLVVATYALTADRIQQQEQIHLLKVLNQVIPADNHDNELYLSCSVIAASPALGTTVATPAYIATKQDKPSGVAIETIAPDGYNGAIKIIVGLSYNAEVTGVRVLSHNETPGLGDKIDLRISDWILSFTGQSLTPNTENQWAVKKDGGQFDQFTGATITPRAIIKATKKVVLYYQKNRDAIYALPKNCQEAK
ncbi:electron transport complex subunit RsxG [Aliivibrio kagoshimensis]|uniref:electron transport complex subunit RsxG n=1 Tax=Aliivibrio kagoshimensis TaxID=2910230 RepID=UPI003D0EA524